MGAHCKIQEHSAVTCVKTAEPIMMPFEMCTRTDPVNHKLDGVPILHEKGQFWRKGSPTVSYRDFLPYAVQQRLNRSICHLGCGLWWAKRSTSSIVFARQCQCATCEGTLAPPCECNWTIPVRRRCGPMSNYFDHLLLMCLTGAIDARPFESQQGQLCLSRQPLRYKPWAQAEHPYCSV